MTEVNSEMINSDGTNYGEVKLHDKNILRMTSLNAKQMLDLTLDNVALCVVPVNNRNEMEMHFHEIDEGNRANDDNLVQITLHFPAGDVPEDEEELDDFITPAEEIRQSLMDTGVIRSMTGDVIAEFTKEQGNFVTPRGKYGIQMTSTFMHMQGSQYSYKIKYTDIGSLYLLPKLEGGREAFVIALEKPIRQGAQKYQYLVLETHKIEHTMAINLTEEEIKAKYDGHLSPEMTMPTSHLIAKIFKVLSQTPVFVSKGFVSARTAAAVRCSLRANEGTLYPLAKAFVFINKPTLILKFEDVECIEFKRYETVGAANLMRNFDLAITMKAGGVKEYSFNLIDRAEYKPLLDFLSSKKLTIKNPVEVADESGKGVKEGGYDLGGGEDGDEDSDDDESYEGGKSDAESSGNDSADSDEDEEDNEKEKEKESRKEKEKKREKPEKEKKEKKEVVKKEKSEKPEKGERSEKSIKEEEGAKKRKSPAISSRTAKEDKDKDKNGKRKRVKKTKDKEAPKAALTSFMTYSGAMRTTVKEQNPEISFTDIARELGNRWKAMDEAAKLPFEEKAKADKERFLREMEAYKKKQSGAGASVEEEDEGGDDIEEDD